MEKQRNINPDVTQVRYNLKKMKKSLKAGEAVDLVKAEEDLSAAKSFFKQVGMFAQADIVDSLLRGLKREGLGAQKQQESVKLLLGSINHLIEKRMVMNQRRCSAEIAFDRSCEDVGEVHPFDVIWAPTQGGWHYSIVIRVDQDSVVCYPVTTASRFQLRKIGCQSVEITGCDVKYLNGQRITSSAVRLDRKRVRVEGHVYHHAMIEKAVNKFNIIYNTPC